MNRMSVFQEVKNRTLNAAHTAAEARAKLLDRIVTLITGAFGFVAALAWNSAMQKWFEQQDWLARGGPWIYAVLVTIIAVLATLWIGKIADRYK